MDLALHLLLFIAAAVVALAVPLTLGRLVRPHAPTPQKGAIYECGEAPIGPGRVQFDLRFYVVALVFIVFDVELAFLFPWAAVYGSAVQLGDGRLDGTTRLVLTERLGNHPPGTLPEAAALSAESARSLVYAGAADLLVFFGVLLVGFAYVWKRGDLDWVRAVRGQADVTPPAPPPTDTAVPLREPAGV